MKSLASIRFDFIPGFISVLFIILFLYTGICKIIDYSVFKEQIATSSLLVPFAKPIAASLPWIEFFVVLLLIIPSQRLKGLYSSLILMLLFTGYILGILIFNKELPCSCGGVIELLSWNQHVIFNSIFILFAGLAIFLERRSDKNKGKTVVSLR